MSDPVTDMRDRAAQRLISKEHLLTPHIVEKEVEIESLGGTVKVRSLTHAQRQEIQQKSGFGDKDFDQNHMTLLSIVYALVEPQLTFEDVEQLKQQDYTVIDELSLQISMLNMVGRSEELKKE